VIWASSFASWRSHVLHEVETLTKQILMIDHGRIVAQGEVSTVRRTLHNRPHAIRVRVEAPRRLATRLAEMEAVVGLRVTGADTLMIETPEPERIYERVPELVLADKLVLYEMAAADESLEALFGYLTDHGNQGGEM